jgi:glycosyltransferase involved in cell wall biosynthesis
VVSGVTRFVALHKEQLERIGHEPYVFTFGGEPTDEAARIIRSPGLPLADTGYFFNLSFSARARNLCRRMDVLHVHHPFMIGQLALRYGRRYGLPVVFTNHTRYDIYTRHYAPALAEVVGTGFLEHYLAGFCNACDLVIAPSAAVAELLRGFGVNQEIACVPNGIEVGRFAHPAQRLERASLGIPEAAKLLIYVGRLAPEKNLAFLLRAFAAATGDLPEAYLLLVGGGPEKEKLQEQAQSAGIGERVIFAGSAEYELIPAYLALADAFVTASTSEVHPLSVLEAMAAGLPVLGVESPGVGETVVDGRNGLLSGDDVAEFSVRLYRLLHDDALRRKLADGARADSARYDIALTTAQTAACYERVIEKKSKQGAQEWSDESSQ